MESYPSETVRFAEIPMLENSGLSDEINENENNRTYSTLVTGMARTAPTVRFADLYFGYSQGPWQARCVYKAQATKSHYVLTDSEPTAEIRYGQFRVTIPKRLLDMTEREAFRFVGYDKDGKLWNSYGDGCSTLGLFTSGRNLSRIELQTRPYTWVKIPRLSLQPPR
jgi:hypothetical protein